MEEAIRRFPDVAEFALRFAVVNAVDDPERSVEYAMRATELAPSDPSVLVRSALLVLSHGEIEAAGRLGRKASEFIDEDFPLIGDFFLLLGRLGFVKDKDHVADKYLRLAFEIDPEGVGAAVTLAHFLETRGRYDEALGVVAQGLEHMPVDSDDLLKLKERLSDQDE